MSIAIDTNVLVRILVQDPTAPTQCAVARQLVADATAAGEPLLVSLCALLETEWVLRSRYRVVRSRFVTFDTGASRLPRGEFLQ
jgi:predicted nucleic-acid-binding protein